MHILKKIYTQKFVLTCVIIFFTVISASFVKTQFFKKPSFLKRKLFENLSSVSIGLSWTDYNNDRYVDIITTGKDVKFYKNNRKGSFIEQRNSGVNNKDREVHATIFGDFDNDGCVDMYMVSTNSYIAGDSLYRNNCTGGFLNITMSAAITDNLNGTSASWGDYDNDGYLDLYVTNYEAAGPGVIQSPQSNILYHNNHDGTFTNVTKRAHVEGYEECPGLITKVKEKSPKFILFFQYQSKESFQPIWFDYNNDGNLDLFVATDLGISPLYRNRGDGTFEDVTKKAGLCRLGSGMGVTAGDYDNDGDFDIYVTNVGANYLWRNNGNGMFTEVAAEEGVADHTHVGWGTEFFDYNNDGYLDLYVANGALQADEEVIGKGIDGTHYDRLFRNRGDGTFEDVTKKEGLQNNEIDQAVAIGDFNNDGFLDILVGGDEAYNVKRNRLYQNTPNGNHWILLKLIGTKSNKDAIGARVELTTGGTKQIRQVISGSSFASQNDLRVHFGIGKATHIDEIKILWPSGKTTTLKKIKPNQTLSIKEEK